MTPSLSPVITADHMQLASLPETEQFLPDEVIFEIFSHLNLQELSNFHLIASRFSKIDDLVLNKILQYMTPFGKEEWETYFGKVSEAPPLPPLKVFKEIYKTYMLVLLPATVDGKPLTLNLFKTLAANPKGDGHVTVINIWDNIVDEYGSVVNGSSRWVLFPKVILEGAERKTYVQQKEMVAAKKGKDYEVTRFFDAVVSIASRQVKSGELLFSDRYTLCHETINFRQDDWPLVVGSIPGGGLDVYFLTPPIYRCYGVAAVRKCPL